MCYQFGNTDWWIDPSAGVAKWMVFMYRNIPGVITSYSGKTIKRGEKAYPEAWSRMIANKAQGSLSPIWGHGAGALRGKNMAGEATDWRKEALLMFDLLPIGVNDVRKAAPAVGISGTAMTTFMAAVGWNLRNFTNGKPLNLYHNAAEIYPEPRK